MRSVSVFAVQSDIAACIAGKCSYSATLRSQIGFCHLPIVAFQHMAAHQLCPLLHGNAY
jgi:hypothetical protein